MAKYLFLGRYTAEGAKGLMKDKASGRFAAAAQAFKSVGATMEACYTTAGKYSFVIIADVPNSISLATIGMVTRAAGTVDEAEVYPLYGAAEVDAALANPVAYRAAGA